MTLKIEKGLAVKEYNNGGTEEKALLEKLFGKKAFMPVMERIKSFEDACEDQGIKPEDVLPYQGKITMEQEAINAYIKLRVIAKSLQEDWTADWSNSNQKKWRVWFEYKAVVGFVVIGTDCVYTYAGTYSGSRLCLPTSELARYFGEQFIELHRIVLEN